MRENKLINAMALELYRCGCGVKKEEDSLTVTLPDGSGSISIPFVEIEVMLRSVRDPLPEEVAEYFLSPHSHRRFDGTSENDPNYTRTWRNWIAVFRMVRTSGYYLKEDFDFLMDRGILKFSSLMDAALERAQKAKSSGEGSSPDQS